MQHVGDTLVYVAGRKRMGKSTYMRAVVIAMASEGWRFVVRDSTNEWAGIRNVLRLSSAEYTVEDAAYLAIEWAPCTLVIDEIDLVCKPSPQGIKPPVINWIVQCGRHARVGLFCASRRPTKVHGDLTNLADAIVLFQLSGSADQRWLCDQEDVTPRLARQVAHYRVGEHYVLRPGEAELEPEDDELEDDDQDDELEDELANEDESGEQAAEERIAC